MSLFLFFFFNDTATTEIYTLSLHDALPISPDRPRPRRWSSTRVGNDRGQRGRRDPDPRRADARRRTRRHDCRAPDRKSTRLNSSHANISYAVFCLKKKKKIKKQLLKIE